MGWGDRDGAVLCANCRDYFFHDEHQECRYHPGSLMDREGKGEPGRGWAGDIWSCCGQRLVWLGDRAWVAGCIAGEHAIDTSEDLSPADLEAAEKALSEIAAKAAIERYERDWRRPERVEDARRRVRRWLAGRLRHRNWETEVAADDVSVLEHADLAFLLTQAGNDQYPVERRRFVASLVTDAERAERIRRAAG